MSESRKNDWVEMMVDHLCEHLPESVADLSDAEIERRAAIGVDRAIAMGLKKDGAVAAYVSLLFLAGPAFDRHPAIAKVLADPSMPPDQRVEKLMSLTEESDWDEAAANPGVWE